MFGLFLKKWLVFGLLVASSVLAAARTQITVFYFFFWALVCYLLVSIIYLILYYYFGSPLKIRRDCLGKITEGDFLDLRCQIENKGPLFIFNIIIEDSLPEGFSDEPARRFFIDSLFSAKPFLFNYGYRCTHRGIYSLLGLWVYFLDPLFGIFYLRRFYPCENNVTIFPKTFPIQFFPPLKRGHLPWYGIKTSRISGDDDEFFGLKEYRLGEMIRRVHWQSSARHNRIIVTQYQKVNFFRATILFSLEESKNYGEQEETVQEYMIRIAASVSRYLLNQNIAVELIAHDGEFVHIPSSRGSQQEENLSTFFAKARAKSKLDLGELIEEAFRYVPVDSTLIIIMLDRDWDKVIQLLPLAKRDIFFIPLVLVASTFQYGVKDRAVLDEIKITLARKMNLQPIMFACGDNLREVFLRKIYA